MGLIKAGKAALESVLADSWRDYFYCESLPNDILVQKAAKKVGRKSSNKGSENIISNGSVVAVNEGQCMIIVDQGRVAEVCAEAGEFVYDVSTEPSLFYGNLGANIKDTFAQLGKRFSFGGDTAKDQRVYFVNIKEITGNKYGTPSPIPYRVVDNNIGLDVDTSLRCHGEYSFRITDPILLYTNVTGNVADCYRKSSLESQMRTELLTSLQVAFARVADLGIRYYQLTTHTQEIANALNEELSGTWKKLRGMEIVSFGVSSAKLPEEDEAMIKEIQRTATLRNASMAAATMTQAQADAMKAAASNTAAGPMMAFAGMNMAAQAGGINANDLYAMAAQQQAAQAAQMTAPSAAPAANAGWTCSCGKAGNTGKFCMECGSPKPADNGWTCSCGAVNKGKFCSECGKPKPAGAKLYRCDKCGWEPEDPANPPKFCPECGDPFGEEDVR